MHIKANKSSLFVLVITALVSSRVLFSLFKDPEGPNLLIVVVMGGVLYCLSLTAYVVKGSNAKKLSLAILIQIVAMAAFYLSMR